MKDQQTVFIARGEKVDLAMLGMMLPHLAQIYKGYTLSFNTEAIFSASNGCGERIVVCFAPDHDEFEVYEVMDFLLSDEEYGDGSGVTVH